VSARRFSAERLSHSRRSSFLARAEIPLAGDLRPENRRETLPRSSRRFCARKTRSSPSSHPVPSDHPCDVHALSPRGSDSNAARRDFLARRRARAPLNFYRYTFSPWNGRISIRRGETTRRICMILCAWLEQSIPRARTRETESSFLRGSSIGYRRRRLLYAPGLR